MASVVVAAVDVVVAVAAAVAVYNVLVVEVMLTQLNFRGQNRKEKGNPIQ